MDISNHNRGYTLLFAVLTSALVLGIGVFIVTTSIKQYELSAGARNSVYSFYAADAGVECAAHAYSVGLIDASSASGGKATITCNGSTIAFPTGAFITSSAGAPSILVPSSVKRTQTDAFRFNTGNGTCSNIVIYDGTGTDGAHYTFMESRGYNKCTSSFGPNTANSGTVERALRLGKKG